MDNLIKAGLIKKNNNSFELCQHQVITTQDVPSVYLRKSHKEYIDKAQYSLEYHSVEERDITGTTLCIQKSKISTAKKLIKEFRKSMTELLESGSKEEVYRLNIQLFPLKK